MKRLATPATWWRCSAPHGMTRSPSRGQRRKGTAGKPAAHEYDESQLCMLATDGELITRCNVPAAHVRHGGAAMAASPAGVTGQTSAAALGAINVASWRTPDPGNVAQSCIDALFTAERTAAWARRLGTSF